MKQISDICNNSNADIVNTYLQEMEHEGLSKRYRSDAGIWVARIALMHNNKPYKKMMRSDVLLFLGTFQKSEDTAPIHKWIGTYNYVRTQLLRCFRWLYNPGLPPPRPKPKVVENIPLMRRREQSIYKPDEWTQEDAALFLKYSKGSRDSCYVSMALDTSARPHELLKLRIKGIVFERQYARVLVNGKTGSRSLVLIDSIPYVKEWISQHPQRNDGEAILLCSVKRRGRISTHTLDNIFSDYQTKYFPQIPSASRTA